MNSCYRLVLRSRNIHQRKVALRFQEASSYPTRGFRMSPLLSARFSSGGSQTDKASRFAAVDHSDAYESSMAGPHGSQLALAQLEGAGKDDPPFDPFLEEEDAGELEIEDEEDSDVDFEAQKKDEEQQVAAKEEMEDEGDGGIDEDDLFEDEVEESMYNTDGSRRRSKSAMATLRAGFPAGGTFAVIELGGTQHKVSTDDLIVCNRLQPVENYKIGSVHTLQEVLLVGSSHMTLVGLPFVTGAEVDLMIEEITQDSKVIVFKKRRRKNSQRKNGFRRDVTFLRVLDVRMPGEFKDHHHVGREFADGLEPGSRVEFDEPSKDQTESQTAVFEAMDEAKARAGGIS